jgi:hypothetical protein
MKRIGCILICLLMALALVACGGGAPNAIIPSDSGMSYEAPSPDEPGWYSRDEATTPEYKKEQQSSKMIYTARIELETTEFDKAISDINALTDSVSGYFEERNLSGYSSDYRYASLVIRVPAEKFDEFCTQVGNVCHLIRLNSSQENVSQTYYDVQSRLTTAQTKLSRLQELLSRAENMEDIITIESAISDVEQTIDYLSGSLRGMDNLVDYATVNVTVNEVYHFSGTKEAPLTLGERLGNAFKSGLESVGDFFEGLAVFLAYSWLWLLMVAGIAVLIVVLIRRGRARRRKKRAEMKENSRPE